MAAELEPPAPITGLTDKLRAVTGAKCGFSPGTKQVSIEESEQLFRE